MHLVGLALRVGLQGAEALIGEHKAGQAPGVGVRGLQNGSQLLPEAAQTQGPLVSVGPTAPRAFFTWACKPEPAGGPGSFSPRPLASMSSALTPGHLLREPSLTILSSFTFTALPPADPDRLILLRLPPHPSGSYQRVVSTPGLLIPRAQNRAWHLVGAQ